MGSEAGTMRQQVARGMGWNGIASACEMVLGIGTSIFLIRLLLPRDFGLFAAAAVFTSFASQIGHGGMGTALVQYKEERYLYGSALIVNLVLLLAAGLAIAALARPIAVLYGEPRITAIVYWLAFGFVLAGIGAVPQAYLAREMRFVPLAFISVTSNSIAAAVALVLAWSGAGVWALVAQTLAKGLTGTLISWCYFPWSKPTRWSWRTCKALAVYGYKAVASGFLQILGNGGVRFVIAKLLGTEALGSFAAAWRLVATPLQAVSGPLASAAFPAMCRKQDAKESLARGYLQMIVLLCVFVGPITVLLGVTAGNIISLIATEEWLAAVPVARVFATRALLTCAFGFSYLVFLAVGKPEYRVFSMLIRTPAVIAGALLGARWGLVGAAGGMLLGQIVAIPVQLYMVSRVLPISMINYLHTLSRATAAIGVLLGVSIVVVLCCDALNFSDGLTLAVVAIVGGGVYCLVSRHLLRAYLPLVACLVPSPRLSTLVARL